MADEQQGGDGQQIQPPKRGRGRPKVYADEKHRWAINNERRKVEAAQTKEKLARLEKAEAELKAAAEREADLHRQLGAVKLALLHVMEILTDEQRQKLHDYVPDVIDEAWKSFREEEARFEAEMERQKRWDAERDAGRLGRSSDECH